MGLDTTHNCWHGPYSIFGLFRKELAKLIGITLGEMEGFGGTLSFDNVKDDLKILINHSDCDGNISPEDAFKLATRLTELLPSIKDKDVTSWAERFAKGCFEAHSLNEAVEFH